MRRSALAGPAHASPGAEGSVRLSGGMRSSWLPKAVATGQFPGVPLLLAQLTPTQITSWTFGECLQGQGCGSTIPLILSGESRGKPKPSRSSFPGTASSLCLTAHDGFKRHSSQGDEGTRQCPQVLPRRSPRATAPLSVFSRCQAGSKSLPSLSKHVTSPSLQPSPDSSAVSKTDPRLPCLLHSSLKPLLAGNDSKCTVGLEEGVGNLELSSDRIPTRQKTPRSQPESHPAVSSHPATAAPQLLLVHFLMLLPFLSACRLSLQWKFSSQNSANQMFRRLLSRVLLEK